MLTTSDVVVNGLIGLGIGLACWKRKKEIDAEGNLCLRYFGPRYAMPMTVPVWILIDIYHMDDPTNFCYSASHLVTLGFVAFSLLACLYFIPYRITLAGNSIERLRWPLKLRRFPLDELTCIGEEGQKTVLYFNEGEILKIHPLLSGQVRFIEKLQSMLTARAGNKFPQPHTKLKKKR